MVPARDTVLSKSGLVSLSVGKHLLALQQLEDEITDPLKDQLAYKTRKEPL